jgi:hypothetical protein
VDVAAAVEQSVCMEAREDFAVAFGMNIEVQLEVEAWFRTVTTAQLLRLAPPLEVPGENYYAS